MKCHAWRNRPNLGHQTQFPKTDGRELEVNKLRDDVGAETGEEVVGCGELTWLMQGGGEWEGEGDDGGWQPGRTDDVFSIAHLVQLRTRKMILSLYCWSWWSYAHIPRGCERTKSPTELSLLQQNWVTFRWFRFLASLDAVSPPASCHWRAQ